MNGTSLTWRCDIRPDLAAREGALRAGIEQALVETVDRLGIDRPVAVTVDPLPRVPAGDWAVHHLDGRRVGRDLEPARRALALVAPDVVPGHADPDPWQAVRQLDDAALAEWAGATVRGTLAARPSLALGPEHGDDPSGLRAVAVDLGWSLADADAFGGSAGGDDAGVPAQPRACVDVSPRLLEWLTTREECRELLAHVGREVRERTGVLTPLPGESTGLLAPSLVVRPDRRLPEPSFRLRTGVLPEVPYAAPRPGELLVPSGTVDPPVRGLAVDPRTGALGWRSNHLQAWETGQGLDAADQLRFALLEHLLAMAYRFVDDRAVEQLLELVGADWPRLARQVRNDVGVGPLTRVLRSLLRERWGIPSLPALLQRLVNACSRTGDLDVLAAARSAAAPLGTDSGRRAIGLPTPVIQLGAADPGTVVDQLDERIDPLEPLRRIVASELAWGGTGAVPLVVVEPPLGNDVRRRVADTLPRLTVVSRGALPRDEPVEDRARVTV